MHWVSDNFFHFVLYLETVVTVTYRILLVMWSIVLMVIFPSSISNNYFAKRIELYVYTGVPHWAHQRDITGRVCRKSPDNKLIALQKRGWFPPWSFSVWSSTFFLYNEFTCFGVFYPFRNFWWCWSMIWIFSDNFTV